MNGVPGFVRAALLVGMVGAAVMTFSIGRALVVGDGGKELRELLAMPWGVVSLVDLYTGFTIFSLWIWLRAESKLAALGWTAGMMVGGFWTGSLYVLMAAFTCGGDVAVLMLGRRRAAYHQVA